MSTRRPRTRRPLSGVAVAGIVLLVLGAALWLLSVLVGRNEPRSYSAHSTPPAYVSVTAGETYSLGRPGGVEHLRDLADPANLTCSFTLRDGATSALAVTAETNPKAVNRIATFVAPATGQAQVTCTGVNDVYVDDADGQVDWSGILLLLAVIALTVGVPLGLSAAATAYREDLAHDGLEGDDLPHDDAAARGGRPRDGFAHDVDRDGFVRDDASGTSG